ncbi:MAG: GTP 3',8-cyclase MoaA [Acidobacteria bacterium]|nr:MAG: GTP 3',8-cyclase MoaA [Acidobacteriota bacterium]
MVERGATALLKDRFGRQIDYLRISVIDHCNLRCVYCMPLRGLSFIPSPELLTAEEIERVAAAAVSVGFRKFRLTGGEPTLRPDLVEIVGRIAALPGVDDVSMTTNAILLPRLAGPLADAGLGRINVHVDTFNPERLKKVMRFGTLDEIERGIAAAEAAGLRPVKINCVVTRDYNDMDVADVARRALERDWHARFIELMPLGGGEAARLSLSQFVPTRETRERIEAALGPLVALPRVQAADESRNYRVEGRRGVIGFISPVSEPYCGTCNRMRLTADGRFHLCLLNDDELDVKKVLRSGGAVADVAAVLARAVGLKPTGHRLEEGISTEERSMFQIGG